MKKRPSLRQLSDPRRWKRMNRKWLEALDKDSHTTVIPGIGKVVRLKGIVIIDVESKE